MMFICRPRSQRHSMEIVSVTKTQIADQVADAVRREVLSLLERGDNWTLTVHGSGSGQDVKLDVRRVARLVMQGPVAESSN